MHRSSCKIFVTLSDFDEAGIFSTNFRKKKSQNIEFHDNSSSGSRVVARGRTDRRADGHGGPCSRCLQFCEKALNGF
jgi:hypothetical protein